MTSTGSTRSAFNLLLPHHRSMMIVTTTRIARPSMTHRPLSSLASSPSSSLLSALLLTTTTTGRSWWPLVPGSQRSTCLDRTPCSSSSILSSILSSNLSWGTTRMMTLINQSIHHLTTTIAYPSSRSIDGPSRAVLGSGWVIKFIDDLIFELGRLLKAVPKKKVSHSRKRMRSAHKGIKPNLSLGRCPGCGEPKRQHFLCLHCYADKFLERSKSVRTPWEKGITP